MKQSPKTRTADPHIESQPHRNALEMSRSPARTPARGAKQKRQAKYSPVDQVEVYCRLRPAQNEAVCARAENDTTVAVFPPDGWTPTRQLAVPKAIESTFTRVFDTLTQQTDIFNHVAVDLIDDVIQGKNGLLFTYGITGSGKTHTMTGTPTEPGLLPRTLDAIFNSLKDNIAERYTFLPDGQNGYVIGDEMAIAMHMQRRKIEAENAEASAQKLSSLRFGGSRKALTEINDNVSSDGEWEERPRAHDLTCLPTPDDDSVYSVFVSYVEIYNNFAYDLLEPSRSNSMPTSKIVREDSEHNTYVSGALEEEVCSSDEAFTLFLRGQKQRRVAHTLLNTESSRSHSVFTIRVVQAPLDHTGRRVLCNLEHVRVSQLSLVDLAGSERTARTQNVGDRIKETGHINNSLLTLRQCIDTLRSNQHLPPHTQPTVVPYRDSKLTFLFKNYFDGHGKVRMLVCLNPCAGDYEENLHVMNFAEATQEVTVKRTIVTRVDDGLLPGRRQRALHEIDVSFAAEFNAYLEAPRADGQPTTSSPAPQPQIFEWMPHQLQLKGSSDSQFMVEMANIVVAREKKKKRLFADYLNTKATLLHDLRQYGLHAESAHRNNERLYEQNRQLGKELNTKTGECKKLTYEMRTLRERLAHYESTVAANAAHADANAGRAQALESACRQKDMKMQQALDIFERGTPRTTSVEHLNEVPPSSPSVRQQAALFGATVDQTRRKAATVRTAVTPSSARKVFGVRQRDDSLSRALQRRRSKSHNPHKTGAESASNSLYPQLGRKRGSDENNAPTAAKRRSPRF